jgi:transketolase
MNLTAPKRKAISSEHQIEALEDIANKLRIHSIEATTASNTGHPTSCSSMAELLAVLFFDPSGMKYHANDPANFNNDKFVLSKGHAAPILYAAWAEAGFIPKEELVNLRKFDSRLEGHPMTHCEFVDVATGSLG